MDNNGSFSYASSQLTNPFTGFVLGNQSCDQVATTIAVCCVYTRHGWIQLAIVVVGTT